MNPNTTKSTNGRGVPEVGVMTVITGELKNILKMAFLDFVSVTIALNLTIVGMRNDTFSFYHHSCSHDYLHHITAAP